jgi:hypothetical protein
MTYVVHFLYVSKGELKMKLDFLKKVAKHFALIMVGMVIGYFIHGKRDQLLDSWEGRKEAYKAHIANTLLQQGAPLEKAMKFSSCISEHFIEAASKANCPLGLKQTTDDLILACAKSNEELLTSLKLTVQLCSIEASR